jgi:hypothetical protein
MQRSFDVILRRAQKYLTYHYNVLHHNCNDWTHALVKDLCGVRIGWKYRLIQALTATIRAFLKPPGYLVHLLEKLTGGREVPEGTNGELKLRYPHC